MLPRERQTSKGGLPGCSAVTNYLLTFQVARDEETKATSRQGTLTECIYLSFICLSGTEILFLTGPQPLWHTTISAEIVNCMEVRTGQSVRRLAPKERAS